MKTRTLIALLLVLGLPLCFAAWAAWERVHTPMQHIPTQWEMMRRSRHLPPDDVTGD